MARLALAACAVWTLLGAQIASAQPHARAALGPPRRAESVVSPRVERALPRTESAGRALASPYVPPGALLGDWNLEISVGTIVPVAVGAGVRLGHVSGVFFDVWGGGQPNAYATIAGDAANAYGVDAGPRSLLVGVLDGAGLFRLAVGVRPLRDVGIELSAGYTMLHGAPTLPRATLEAATGQSFVPAGDRIGLSLTVHAVHVEFGYALVLFDHLVVRAMAGAALAVAADFHVAVPAEMRVPGGAVDMTERSIAGGIPGRVFVPTLRLEVGARF